MYFMSARYVIDALYVYVVAVVYAASCCSHGPCYIETTWCRNIKYSWLIRYPPYLILLHSEAHEVITVSILYHGTHLNWGYESPLQMSNFKHLTLISHSKYKKVRTLIWWHTVDSCLAYIGLMENCVCQLFLKFAYLFTEFWIRWCDYLQRLTTLNNSH